jgi:hypothetical protein
MITTSSLPYLLISAQYLITKLCNKKAPKFKRFFSLELKYATYLTITSVCFMYGVEMPFIFVVGALSFTLQYLLDRLLITYWFEV